MLTCPYCDSYTVELVDDNGVSDPAVGTRLETYDCHQCGSGFQLILVP